MIDAILKGFGKVVELCYNLGGKNYLLGLIIFAMVVKILMLPLSIKQQKNQIKQAKLRPKEMAIRKKYAGRNDQPTQQKMQNEIMELYQRENFNPMGGCLPMLIQLPILLGLYQVVIRPLEFLCGVPKAVANGLMKLEAISSQGIDQQIKLINFLSNGENFQKYASTNVGTADNPLMLIDHVKSVADFPSFEIGRINLANIPSLNNINTKEGLILLLVPVLTFVFMFISMKITRKLTYNAAEGTPQDANAGCSNAVMDYMMPLMSVYITFIVPSVIGIYWIFNNIFGTIQQILLAKFMPIPKFTEEDYKRAEKEMNGKYKPEKKSNGEKKKVRSLHRIDEEDYIAPEPEKKKKEEKGGLEGMIDKPQMKEDDK